jgi:hypothetical protein
MYKYVFVFGRKQGRKRERERESHKDKMKGWEKYPESRNVIIEHAVSKLRVSVQIETIFIQHMQFLNI